MDRLLQTITVECPGVTADLIKLQLFNVLDEFFRRTSAWRYYEDIALEQGNTEYPFSIPTDSAIVRVLAVAHNGLPLRAASLQQGGITQSSLGTLIPELTFPDGDAKFAPTETDKDDTGLFSYTIYRPNYIQTTVAPDEEAVKYPLNVCLALTVSRGCLECDCGDWALEEWMYDMFFDNWLDGALNRLMGMVSKPWTNPTMSSYYGKRFRNAMAFRKQEALRGFTYNTPAWRFPRWA
jgi:hypothetical protein